MTPPKDTVAEVCDLVARLRAELENLEAPVASIKNIIDGIGDDLDAATETLRGIGWEGE